MFFVLDADAELNMRALAARDDEAALETFIRKNKRFILSCAYRTTRRFVSESDDEWSVALIAFHEAVQTYDGSRGDFRPFAALVIKRRLIDHLGREARTKSEISVDSIGGELAGVPDAAPIQLEVQRKVAERSMEASAAESAVREEIEAMRELLDGYGFSFFDLAECSPKAQKTRLACAAVIRALVGDGALMRDMRRTGTLPVKSLCRQTNVARKLLEHHRKYIIAAAEILYGDFPQLAEYLRFVKEGVRER